MQGETTSSTKEVKITVKDIVEIQKQTGAKKMVLLGCGTCKNVYQAPGEKQKVSITELVARELPEDVRVVGSKDLLLVSGDDHKGNPWLFVRNPEKRKGV